MSEARILVVEDERIVAEDIKEGLQSMGYTVTSVARSGKMAIKMVEENRPDLVLMDIVLKDKMDGIETAEQIRSRFNIPVIYLTAYSDEKILERAKITEPFGYIIKPFTKRELHINIEIALYNHKMEKKLKESEQWLSATLQSIVEAVMTTDKNGVIITMNPFAEALTGWKREDAFGKPLKIIFNVISEDTGKQAENPVTKLIREGSFYGLAENTILITKEGGKIPVEIIGSLIKDDRANIIGIVLVFYDIIERKKEEQLKASLKEKEILLGEIHHRVKNNIQVISSLLSLQSEYITEEKYRDMFKESQNRILSMALIHEKLYQSKDFAKIDLNEYINDLGNDLFRYYGINTGNIRLNTNIENVYLGIESAIPCGLIINELVTNSLKHAFPDGRKGEIKISLRPIDVNVIELAVSDNGIGIPKDLDFRNTESLGLHLVTILAENQLQGEINLDRSKGTEFKIKFKGGK